MAEIERRSLITLKNLGKLESKGWLADAQGRLGCSLAFLGEEVPLGQPRAQSGPWAPFPALCRVWERTPVSQGERVAGGAFSGTCQFKESSQQAVSKPQVRVAQGWLGHTGCHRAPPASVPGFPSSSSLPTAPPSRGSFSLSACPGSMGREKPIQIKLLFPTLAPNPVISVSLLTQRVSEVGVRCWGGESKAVAGRAGGNGFPSSGTRPGGAKCNCY